MMSLEESNKILEKENKKLKKLIRAGEKSMSANPTFFEKLGGFISKLKTKEMKFDKEYVKEIKCETPPKNSGNIKQYQRIVLLIKLVESVRFIFIVWQVFLYLKTKI